MFYTSIIRIGLDTDKLSFCMEKTFHQDRFNKSFKNNEKRKEI